MSVYPHDELAPIPNRPGVAARVFAGPETGVTAFFLVEDEMTTGATIPLHTHPVDEVLVVTEGALTVTLGNETQVVPHGHTVVIPPGTPHRLTNEGAAATRFLAAAAWNRATFYREASHYLEGGPRRE